MATTLIKPQEVVNGGIVRPAPFNVRFDSQLLAPNILPAEQRFLMPILCLEFYEDLVAEQGANSCNYNADLGALQDKFPSNALYETLWTESGLYELCARIVFFTSLPYIALQTGSNGIYANNTEYAQNEGTRGAKYLQDNELKNIEALQERVLNWLCRNKSDYPLFDQNDTLCKDVEGCGTCKGEQQYKHTNPLHKVMIF